MRKGAGVLVVSVLAILLSAGCAKKEGAVDNAVDKTKDALNIREHEKLKDAGEDAKDAVDNAVQGVKDAANGKD